MKRKKKPVLYLIAIILLCSSFYRYIISHSHPPYTVYAVCEWMGEQERQIRWTYFLRECITHNQTISFHQKKFPKMKKHLPSPQKETNERISAKTLFHDLIFAYLNPLRFTVVLRSVTYEIALTSHTYTHTEITHIHTSTDPDTPKIAQEQAGCCKYNRPSFLFWFLALLFLFSLLIVWRVVRIVVGTNERVRKWPSHTNWECVYSQLSFYVASFLFVFHSKPLIFT